MDDTQTQLANAMIALYERVEKLEQDSVRFAAEKTKLQDQIDFLMVRNRLEHGLIPELSTLSMIEVQIFHRETLTTKQKQARFGHWSVSIELSVDGERVGGKIDVGLFSGDKFARTVLANPDAPAPITRVATMAENDPECLLGMVSMKTQGKGRPYSFDQFIMLSGYDEQKPEVFIWVNGKMTQWGVFAPGKGTRANHALYYAKWKPSQLYTYPHSDAVKITETV